MNSSICRTSCKFVGTGMIFKIWIVFRRFSCTKLLRWSFAYSAMLFHDSLFNWYTWFILWNQLASGLGDLVLRRFWIFFSHASFSFYCFVVPYRCCTWMRKNHAKKWNWFSFSFSVSFSPKTSSFSHVFVRFEPFSERSTCHLISAKIWERNFSEGSLKFLSSVLLTCE